MATSIPHPHADRVKAWRQYADNPLADPCVSVEEHHRLAHRDLARLDARQLERERYRARHRALVADSPTPWLAEQLATLDSALAGCGRGRVR